MRHFIKEWMEFRDINQAELARLVRTSPQSISRILSGDQEYTRGSLEAIAIALNCKPADLLNRSPTEEPEGFSLLDLDVKDRETIQSLIDALAAKTKASENPPLAESVRAREPGSRRKKSD